MKELRPKELAFVAEYVVCRNGAEAARRAGYAAPSARITASRLLTKANINAALAAAEAKLARKSDITKAKVIEELLEACGVAKLRMDGGNMIRSMSEIAKMLGYYKVQEKCDVPRAETAEERAKYEAMSDEELQRLVDAGKSKTPA